MAPFSMFVRFAWLSLFWPITLASAQRADTTAAGLPPHPDPLLAAARYETVFDALRKLAPRGDSVATVRNLTFQRDAIQFRLAEGRLYLLTPVAGRTVATLFLGHGAVSFIPPWDVERARLARMLHDSIVDAGITAAVFLFTDSTLAELTHRLTFAPAPIPEDARGPVGDALDRLVNGRARSVGETESTTLMSALLNGYANGLFYAHVKREHGEDLMFQVDPEEPEQVALLRGGKLRGQKLQIVSQFPRAEDLTDSIAVGVERPYPVTVNDYRIDATVAKGLDYSATASFNVTARRDGIRWTPFLLYHELKVDSVLDETGSADSFFRAKHSPELWVRFNAPLATGQTHTLRIVYHGDLITFGRPGPSQWFYLKDPVLWFPRHSPPAYGYGEAFNMDLTFHAPEGYLLASSGRLVDSTVDHDARTTHWVTERPTPVASFTIGRFTEYQVTDPRIPPVTVHWNREAHMHQHLFLQAPDPEQQVGADVANSLAFFTRAFGPPLYRHYYATEIPFGHGQAFPGMIHLSWETFLSVTESGADERFRAHEIAHQWWGIGVEPATYRDAWLSEGFAEFAGLWYMQLALNDNEKFFKQLKNLRDAIRARRDEMLPTGLGSRVFEISPRDYMVMIYGKGAWIVQMLRNLLLDFRTMREDRFSAMMQDYYQQYRGRRARTRDFQRVVERHMDMPMDWFFDEWVNGTAIPTYIFSWHAEPTPDKQYALKLRVRQEDVPREFVMPVPIRIELAGGGHAFVRINVRGPTTETEVRLPAEPTDVELNPLASVLAEVKTEGWQ